MKILVKAVGPFVENTYLVGCEETGEAVIIDPGDEEEELLRWIDGSGWTLKLIVNTHGHIDHTGAVARLREEKDVPFLLHEEEVFWLKRAPEQASFFGLPPRRIPEVDRFLEEGEKLLFGKVELEVLLCPGHSPGHLCFFGQGHAFVGDTLFAGSIGRTDLPGCSPQALLHSIKEKMLPLGDDIIAHPGHGPDTSFGQERRTNPFLAEGGNFWMP